MPGAMPPPRPPQNLSHVAMVMVMSDSQIRNGALDYLAPTLAAFPHHVVFGDTRNEKLGVHACCEGKTYLGSNLAMAQEKLEHVYRQVWLMFAPTPGLRWFIFSDHDVWWNTARLPRYFEALDEALALRPHAAGRVVAGGGDDSNVRVPRVFGCYTILSRATLQLLAQVVAAAGQPGSLLPFACLAPQPHAVVAQLHADVAR